MIGDICKHLGDFGVGLLGRAGWNRLCEELSIQDTEDFVRSDEAYLDKDFNLIVEMLAKKTNQDAKTVWRHFGEKSTSQFIEKDPHFLQPYASPRELLVALNDMHYVQVKAKYSKASLPYFYHQAIAEDKLVTRYCSKRRLCHYFEGGLETLAKHYKSPVSYKQTCCQNEGAAYCEFEIGFV